MIHIIFVNLCNHCNRRKWCFEMAKLILHLFISVLFTHRLTHTHRHAELEHETERVHLAHHTVTLTDTEVSVSEYCTADTAVWCWCCLTCFQWDTKSGTYAVTPGKSVHSCFHGVIVYWLLCMLWESSSVWVKHMQSVILRFWITIPKLEAVICGDRIINYF